ncbi:MAG: hypothetical protein ACK559_13580, partial [bacterium]
MSEVPEPGAADAAASSDGVRKRTKFATVVTREFVPTSSAPVEVSVAGDEGSVPMAADAVTTPDAITAPSDESGPRKSRFATIVTREPALRSDAPAMVAPATTDE